MGTPSNILSQDPSSHKILRLYKRKGTPIEITVSQPVYQHFAEWWYNVHHFDVGGTLHIKGERTVLKITAHEARKHYQPGYIVRDK